MIQFEQYYIETTLTDKDGELLDLTEVEKIVFQFENVKKTYLTDGTSTDNIVYEDGVFRIYLTQEETGSFEDNMSYQTAVKFKNGDVRRTLVKYDDLHEDIIGVI